MKLDYSNLLGKWMRLLNTRFHAKELKKNLLSHPDYPSLLSITDTLDYYNIPNETFSTNMNSLDKVPLPFLIHITNNGREFQLIENKKALIKTKSELSVNWQGLVVAAEPSPA